MIWLFGAGAALSAVGTEVYYRAHVGESWGPGLWPGLVGGIVTNLLIFGMLQHGSIVALAVVFALFSATLRVAYTLAVGDHVSTGTWIAFGLVVAASVVKGAIK